MPDPTPPPATAAPMLEAWVDESMPRVEDGTDSVYLLAAVVADPTSCDDIRETMTSLRVKREPKLHWHREDEPRRRKIVSTISTFDVASIIVVGAPLDSRRQERARVQCLDELLMTLDRLGVTRVHLEQRETKLNQRDLQHVDRLRGMQLISKTLRVETARPSTEPMLWIPDAICGSVGAAQTGQTEWIDILGNTIELIPITLR